MLKYIIGSASARKQDPEKESAINLESVNTQINWSDG